MRSSGKGCLSAVTQVKVLSPEIILFALGQGFHFLEASTGLCANGEHISGMPGSKSTAGKRTAYIGTWENRYVPNQSRLKMEDMIHWYGVSVIGLTHSSGVAGVTARGTSGSLEGVSGLTQRGRLF